MRMSDKPTVDAETFIQAPPSDVWELVTDIVRMGQWSPEYQGGEWLDEATGPAVGARFRGRNKRADREWQSTSTVTEADAGRSFEWAVGDPANASATWRFDLAPQGSGTLLRQHVELGPGPSGLTARIEELPDREEEIVASRTAGHRSNMQATLEGIKSAAEGEPSL